MTKANLNEWLLQRGFKGNPFELSNAEYEIDVPQYFVENTQFDDSIQSSRPRVIFADRGSGKTALRQMLSVELKKKSSLVIHFTYQSYERILARVDNHIENIQVAHYVDAILNNAILTLPVKELFEDNRPDVGNQQQSLQHLQAFIEKFAPEAISLPTSEGQPFLLDKLGNLQLLIQFLNLIKKFGYLSSTVLVDDLDEFYIAGTDESSRYIIDLLAPILGTLPIIECPGIQFIFFLPLQIEDEIIKKTWFRSDRLSLSHIVWDHNALKSLLRRRVSYYSQDRYQTIAQLCRDDLAEKIEDEIVTTANKLPRSAIELANRLFQTHLMQDDPSSLITLQTWKETKRNWGQNLSGYEQKNSQDLMVDNTKGEVWLGNKEIRKKITPQDYRVLLCLYQHRPEPCTKERIIEDAWEATDGVSDEAIAASIRRLREIFRTEGLSNFDYIETIRGTNRNDGAYRIRSSSKQ